MRRSLVFFLLVPLVLACRTGRPEAAVGDGVTAEPLQKVAYRVPDASKDRTESWLFDVDIREAQGREASPVGTRIELLSAKGEILKTIDLGPVGVKAITLSAPRPLPAKANPTLHRIRFKFTEPAGFPVDKVRCRIDLVLATEERVTRTVEVPVSGYQQKTELIFPFRGPGIVMQGGFNDGGHRNRSGLFAIDVLGLTAHYAPQVSGEDRNEAYAGWGREILAPGDGVVTFARNDVPENTVLDVDPDPQVYTMPDGAVVDTGNSVVIDHGNGEFSLVAHMQKGSVRVRAGDRVTRGQVIGLLGNSGNSSGPHVHYQLMTGPDRNTADGLPVRFPNVNRQLMARGTWFEAK
jgi:hypothetical protein